MNFVSNQGEFCNEFLLLLFNINLHLGEKHLERLTITKNTILYVIIIVILYISQ